MIQIILNICNQLQFNDDDDDYHYYYHYDYNDDYPHYHDYDDDDDDDKVTQSYLQATSADGPPKIVQRICPPRTSGQT